jgi:hypothetical protein
VRVCHVLFAVSLYLIADPGWTTISIKPHRAPGVLLADLYNQGMPTSPDASPFVLRQRVAKHRAICGRCRHHVLR